MRIDETTLQVLYRLETTPDLFGEPRVHIRIAGQLDRALYTKVNKVLEACGGKWSRHHKAHLLENDALQQLETAIVNGEVSTRRDVGFFETPKPLAKQLVAMADVQPGHVVLEPSAGTGRIVDAIRAAGGDYIFCERDELMRSYLWKRKDALVGYHSDNDFLDLPIAGPYALDRVVMNPPFCKVGKGDHLDHVRHAFAMLMAGGPSKQRGDKILVSVLPAGVKFRTDRRHAEFREWFVSEAGELTDLPDGSFKASGTGVRTCVLHIARPWPSP